MPWCKNVIDIWSSIFENRRWTDRTVLRRFLSEIVRENEFIYTYQNMDLSPILAIPLHRRRNYPKEPLSNQPPPASSSPDLGLPRMYGINILDVAFPLQYAAVAS